MGDLTFLLIIVFVFGGGYLKRILSIQERRLEIEASLRERGMAGTSQEVADLKQQVSMLRAELAQLRDTSTQYDMSLQNTLEETQHRLAFMEAKSRGVPADQPVQPIGLNKF